MANNSDRWYFLKEKIRNSPSVKDGIEHSKELGYRQQCANLVQDIGQRLQVNQLVINTAIVYMHRFYMYHSFNKFHRNVMAPCFVFLAAKIEEMPRKLEHVLKAAHVCLRKEDPPLDVKSDEYMQLTQELVNNESILLQTLGFEVSVDHPNTFVVKCAQLVKASKELAQTAYFLATNSLHLTTFCIEIKPTVVACVCIYVSCLWANYIIPETDGKNWYEFIEPTCTKKHLEDLSSYFIKILDSSPTRLKKKLTSGGAVVYKEGKVVQKNSSSNPSSKKSAPVPSANTNSTNNNHSSTPTSKAISKTHLTGMLKPQSHEATPPPSSHRTSHHSNNVHRKHPEHANGSKTDPNSKLKDPKANNKTPEEWMEHKRKTLTPEQFEEYKKRKEHEKKLYYQQRAKAKKEAAEKQQKEKSSTNGNTNSNGNTKPINNDLQKLQNQKMNSHHHGSPAKRQKLEDHRNHGTADTNNKNSHDLSNTPNSDPLRKSMPSNFSLKHRTGLSSSGSDSEPNSDARNNHSKHVKSNHLSNKTLPPPPKLPNLSKSNDSMHISQPPGSTNRNSYNKLPPPPPPPVASKYA